jgi:hypothetical protein
MKKTIAGISLLVLLVTAAAVGPQPAAADPVAQSASGSGQVHLGLPHRNFAFSATKQADGSVTGQAQLKRSDTGTSIHIEIDCLNVLGNIAVMSGVITATNSPVLAIGDDELFAVRDNGQGPDAPTDEITLAWSGLGIACTAIPDPNLLLPFLFTIETGQIQVRA